MLIDMLRMQGLDRVKTECFGSAHGGTGDNMKNFHERDYSHVLKPWQADNYVSMRSRLPENIVSSVVKQLAEIRKQRGFSHETVGLRSGLHRSTISLIEARKREATLLTLIKICKAMDCDLGPLVSQAENEHRKGD